VLIPSAFSECDSTISQNETIGSVKAKLACFAEENAMLKQQLASARTNGAPHLTLQNEDSDFFADDASFTTEGCKNRAIAQGVKHDGIVEAQGDDWVSFKIGAADVMVRCRLYGTAINVKQPDCNKTVNIQAKGEVELCGLYTNSDKDSNLVDLLTDEIFPK
jgi:hypothetical protein